MNNTSTRLLKCFYFHTSVLNLEHNNESFPLFFRVPKNNEFVKLLYIVLYFIHVETHALLLLHLLYYYYYY